MTIADIPERERLLSEQYRVAAKEWVELDGAARLLEEIKTTVLAQRMKSLGDKPAAHAERDVKSSAEWAEFIREMVEARTKANLARVKLKWLEIRFSEWQSREANERAERKFSR